MHDTRQILQISLAGCSPSRQSTAALMTLRLLGPIHHKYHKEKAWGPIPTSDVARTDSSIMFRIHSTPGTPARAITMALLCTALDQCQGWPSGTRCRGPSTNCRAAEG